MATSIYITSAEGSSGKSTIALGILDALRAKVEKVGVFRPVARSREDPDYVLQMLLDHDGVDLVYEECVGVTYDDVHQDADAAMGIIVEKFRAVERSVRLWSLSAPTSREWAIRQNFLSTRELRPT